MREFYKWRDDVVEQIRFRPDRAAVAEELTAHYEDHVKDLERLGYEHELADQRALGDMGDPVEIGKAMDRVHQPWLGWLWLVSKALAVLSLIAVLLYGGSNYITIVQDLEWPEKETDYEADGYLSDSDNPYFTRVAMTKGSSTEVCGYTFSIPYAALWKDTLDNSYYNATIVLAVRDNRFWDDAPDPALRTMNAVDSHGDRYLAVRTKWDLSYTEYKENWDGLVRMSLGQSARTPFYEEYIVSVDGIDQWPEYLDLICDSGEGFALRVEWEAVE
ncbi:hypothetical protein JQM66_12095 [Oscillibacter valericigenes]|uniref:permease prefix domain 1-containing protein n=1 Tax=Oscillibacter valericigenes TaxID=351091 RepID=UPI001F3299A2|nr:permease prefix domain 1-containing protein [Oscillibacter valericigenes]MCF2665287.1 hypothetical protein [Oscillibacter valericigenes]